MEIPFCYGKIVKKKALLSLLDIIIGLAAGFFGYDILSHDADAVDWCIVAICFVVVGFRLYTIIKSTRQGG